MNEWMHKMNALLVSMAVNKYRKNGSTDWRQRPECSHILSQLKTFMTNKPIIGDKEFNSVFDAMFEKKCDILYEILMRSEPYCIIRMSNEYITKGQNFN